MSLIRFVIHRKTFVSMLFIGLTLLGYISYKNLPVELYPSVELPVMIVRVDTFQDMEPGYIENYAIIPLEGAIGTLDGVESIDSYADHRSGMIFITYKDKTETKYAYLKLQEKIENIKSSLPEEFIVNVLKIDTEQISNQFMDLEVRGSGGTDRVRNVVDNRIYDELVNIDGIASVEVFGGREKSIEIILNKELSEAYGITPAQVSSLISQNDQQRTFVGLVKSDDRKFFVNVTSESEKLADIENIVVRPTGPIRLKDIADIYFGVKEETTYSRVNGKESVTVRLIRDSQVNLIDLSHEVRDVIDKLNQKLKYLDVEVVVQRDVAESMEENIDLIMQLAVTGGLLAIIILWIFLRNIKLVITISLAIPISIFTAFNFFYAYDISLNSLTLIGMALAIGMLLDNSIVVLENIYRLSGNGMQRDEAVAQGTSEVWRSIFAATLTTITVFLPFLFTSNYLINKFGMHIGVSIISTLLVSLLVALLMIPMITHTFLRSGSDQSVAFKQLNKESRLIQIYLVLLRSSMRFPARSIVTAVVVFFASVFIALAVSINVTEEVETDTFNLYVEMPNGSTLASSDEVARKVEERLEDLKEKQDVISKVYEDQSTITIKLKENYKEIAGRSIEDIKSEIEERVKNIGNAEISFDEPQSSQRFRGGAGSQMGNRFARMLGIGAQRESVLIKGNDFGKMKSVAEDITYYLESLSSVRYATMSASENRPEVQLLFDQYLLSQYDITLNAIVSELGTFSREFSSNTKFKQGTEEYDITITTSGGEEEKTIDDLRRLKISGGQGSTHDLEEISRIIYSEGLSSISRVNQEKQIEVTYGFYDEVNDSKSLRDQGRAEIDDMIAGLIIPSGIAIEVVDTESQYDEYYFLIAIAVLLIYMILAAVFESFITPLVLMFSIPLAAIGSLVALILTGNSLLNSNTLTGFLILLGVVVNNGIILIDYSNILEKRGYRNSRALITAGLARVRPILITAITTIVAMMPLALGRTEYVTTIGAPFAITVIGGLSLSTLFTLIFIPTMYSGLHSALKWLRGLNWIIKGVQLLSFIALSILIYLEVDSFIWQLVDLFLVVLIIPGLTYFVMTSLKQAKTKLISDSDPIKIEIRNVVKIYDQPSRFIREWNRGKSGIYSSKYVVKARVFLDQLMWQIPLLGFLVYYTYIYLEKPFWNFVMVHFLFFYILYLIRNPFSRYIDSTNLSKGNLLYKLTAKSEKLFLWFFPLFNLVLFQISWDNITIVIIIALLWYSAILIHSTSQKIYDGRINSEYPKSRLGKLKYRFYSLVRVIPLIGKKRIPFKALDRVSVDIGSGMFGLLGPNGAGKTTIMRIICGILDQSYGKVRINGLDRQQYHEELQGLFGYLPQEFGMYENMTAYEFLNYQAILKNILDRKDREDRITRVLESVHMNERKHEKISSYSGGMKQRIGIAQILLHLPRILVVDEPTAGLDPRERIRFRNLLVELSRERVVIFSTHIIEDISSSCKRVAVLNKGEVRYLGEPANMTKTAEGKVWQLNVSQKEFETVKKDMLIVNHMRDGDKIRIRCISNVNPGWDAVSVRATLEDAYLYLQKQNDTSIFSTN